MSTGSPAPRVRSTSSPSTASPGCGVRSASSESSVWSTRSTSSSLRISASASRLVSPTVVIAFRAVARSVSSTYCASPAWSEITDMWCATMSCSSLAMRTRSSATARAARSASRSARRPHRLVPSPSAHAPSVSRIVWTTSDQTNGTVEVR